MGVTVAKPRKKRSGKAPDGSRPNDAAGEDEKDTATKMVRLRPEFQVRLMRVAKDGQMSAGELIEAHLGEFVNREFKRIVLAEAASLRGE